MTDFQSVRDVDCGPLLNDPEWQADFRSAVQKLAVVARELADGCRLLSYPVFHGFAAYRLACLVLDHQIGRVVASKGEWEKANPGRCFTLTFDPALYRALIWAASWADTAPVRLAEALLGDDGILAAEVLPTLADAEMLEMIGQFCPVVATGDAPPDPTPDAPPAPPPMTPLERHKIDSPTVAGLIEYMQTRRVATFEEIKVVVHDNEDIVDSTVGSNMSRANKWMIGKGYTWRLVIRGKEMIKEG
jgi:hypothetical protein